MRKNRISVAVLLAVILFTAAGCKPAHDVQPGSVQGRIVSIEADEVPEGSNHELVSATIEFVDQKGARDSIIEKWPFARAGDFKIGQIVDIHFDKNLSFAGISTPMGREKLKDSFNPIE